MEDVAGQALGVHAHEHVLRGLDLALHERDVVLAGQRLAEGDRGELAVRGREPHGVDPLDELLVRRRYSIRSATVTIVSPCRSQ